MAADPGASGGCAGFVEMRPCDTLARHECIRKRTRLQPSEGPIADALTHVGQINILRRLAGIPVRAENYFVAEITAGRVGADQAAPTREFE